MIIHMNKMILSSSWEVFPKQLPWYHSRPVSHWTIVQLSSGCQQKQYFSNCPCPTCTQTAFIQFWISLSLHFIKVSWCATLSILSNLEEEWSDCLEDDSETKQHRVEFSHSFFGSILIQDVGGLASPALKLFTSCPRSKCLLACFSFDLIVWWATLWACLIAFLRWSTAILCVLDF